MSTLASPIVVECDERGLVRHVLGGSQPLARAVSPGRTLADVVVPAARKGVRDLLDVLGTTGIAFDQLLTQGSDEPGPRWYAAGARIGAGYCVSVAVSPEEASEALEEALSDVEGAEAEVLRYVLRDRRVLATRTNGQSGSSQPASDDAAGADLERRQDALEQHERQRDEFVSMAAHELRNPLSTIRFYAGCLLDLDLPEDKQRRFISIIQETSTFMGQLIEELLTVSTVEAGQLRLVMEERDVCSIAHRCYEVHRLLAEEKQIRLEFVRCADSIPAMVDGGKLVQVFNNLLSNAVKFSEPGTEIEMRLTAQSDSVCIAVQDQGPGIPPDELSLLFKPFQRTSVRSTAGERSTGLGLAICHNIVAGHDGRLWVDSEVGRGSTFYVELPRRLRHAGCNGECGRAEG